MNAILGDDLAHEVWLLDDEPGAELMNALFHAHNALLEGHVLAEIVVEDGVHEVCSIPVSALLHLLESAEVVHPVELGFAGGVLEAANEAVHLVGPAAQCLGELTSHPLGGGLNRELDACAECLKLQVLLDVVCELVAVGLLA